MGSSIIFQGKAPSLIVKDNKLFPLHEYVVNSAFEQIAFFICPLYSLEVASPGVKKGGIIKKPYSLQALKLRWQFSLVPKSVKMSLQNFIHSRRKRRKNIRRPFDIPVEMKPKASRTLF